MPYSIPDMAANLINGLQSYKCFEYHFFAASKIDGEPLENQVAFSFP